MQRGLVSVRSVCLVSTVSLFFFFVIALFCLFGLALCQFVLVFILDSSNTQKRSG